MVAPRLGVGDWLQRDLKELWTKRERVSDLIEGFVSNIFLICQRSPFKNGFFTVCKLYSRKVDF